MSFTENLYLKRMIQQLQEENLKLRKLLQPLNEETKAEKIDREMSLPQFAKHHKEIRLTGRTSFGISEREKVEHFGLDENPYPGLSQLSKEAPPLRTDKGEMIVPHILHGQLEARRKGANWELTAHNHPDIRKERGQEPPGYVSSVPEGYRPRTYVDGVEVK